MKVLCGEDALILKLSSSLVSSLSLPLVSSLLPFHLPFQAVPHLSILWIRFFPRNVLNFLKSWLQSQPCHAPSLMGTDWKLLHIMMPENQQPLIMPDKCCLLSVWLSVSFLIRNTWFQSSQRGWSCLRLILRVFRREAEGKVNRIYDLQINKKSEFDNTDKPTKIITW